MSAIFRLILATVVLSGRCLAQTPSLSVEGIEGKIDDNVLAHLSLHGVACDTPRWLVERLFHRSEDEILQAMKAFGYYHAAVEQTLSTAPPCWRAHFQVEPGPRTEIATVDLRIVGEAAQDPAFSKVRRQIPLRPGDPLHHGRYEEAKALLQSLASESGYFDSRFTVHQLRVDPATNRADVVLHFDSGPRYRFGELRIDQDILEPDFVARYADIDPGEPYAGKKLTALNQALTNSGYFSAVDIRPRIRRAKDLRVPVDVKLSPRKRHQWSAGVGFDTDTGPRITGSYENRRVNRQGHQASLNLKYSPVLSEAAAEYRIPLLRPIKEYLSLRAGFKHEDTDSVDSDSYVAGARWVVLRDSGWLETRSLDLLHENFDSGGDRGSATLLVPGIGWSRRWADNSLRVRKGYRADFELRGGHDALLSDTSFIQARAYGKGIYSLPWEGRLIGRAELGATAVDDFSELPASYRFYAGGDQSVRGYGYKDLGPKEDGDTRGGRYLTVFSVEYDHPVSEDWRIAAFVDSGNATDSLDFDLKTGAGVGVRWQTPIGPLRLDIAFPLDESDDDFRIHFAMGPEI